MHIRKVKKIWIYMLGMAPLAFFYEPVKRATGESVFLLAVVYLIVVRLQAEKLGRC